MNRNKWILGLMVCLMVGSTAVVMARMKAGQKLGAPGLKTSPLVGSQNLRVELPADVPGFESKWVEVDDVTRQTLPKDTSYGQRQYFAPDGFAVQSTVVLMGGDRSSLHKPQFCLTGQGWIIDPSLSEELRLPITQPVAYELPVVKLVSKKEITVSGRTMQARGIYVYWYVADGVVSASTSGVQRMWWMARDLIRTGVLQRWAYVSYFAVCEPGQENATFERMKGLIMASVPQFQHPPNVNMVSTH
jgi:hypothetical protein